MAAIALTLGGIALQSFEVPSAVAVAGKQRFAVHRLLSGAQIVDVLGPDQEIIEWSGALSGNNASERVCEFDRMRQVGMPLLLSWGVFSYSVFISEFKPDYQNRWWIPYSISCLVLQDLSAPVSALLTEPLDAVAADLANAAVYANVSTFQSAAAAGNVVPGSAAYAAAISAGTVVQAALQAQLVGASDVLAGNFGTSLVACQALAVTANASAYVARAMTNLINLEP